MFVVTHDLLSHILLPLILLLEIIARASSTEVIPILHKHRRPHQLNHDLKILVSLFLDTVFSRIEGNGKYAWP